ncbi:hypothetical protein [Natronoglycomyces albus]|uniref:Uncharacterized protein n=1 Tax=Natronoglycomyces albus TaxID=2811108 RepID=A0A895XLF4_9ACTN|nr:hypothetical protein [Natronoglycomyces albus]QSB04249.1 hypothetical protein JQS30_10585 [Natronoglycomyces albus]
MIVSSLLILLAALGLLTFGVITDQNSLLVASIVASLLAGVALFLGARASAQRAKEKSKSSYASRSAQRRAARASKVSDPTQAETELLDVGEGLTPPVAQAPTGPGDQHRSHDPDQRGRGGHPARGGVPIVPGSNDPRLRGDDAPTSQIPLIRDGFEPPAVEFRSGGAVPPGSRSDAPGRRADTSFGLPPRTEPGGGPQSVPSQRDAAEPSSGDLPFVDPRRVQPSQSSDYDSFPAWQDDDPHWSGHPDQARASAPEAPLPGEVDSPATPQWEEWELSDPRRAHGANGHQGDGTSGVNAYGLRAGEAPLPPQSEQATGAPRDSAAVQRARDWAEEAPAHADWEIPEDEPSGRSLTAVEAASLMRLDATVHVIDGRPRFHLSSCSHLLGRDEEPLEINEAIELGFTPCVQCDPAGNLSATPALH